jgi:hypothetical protein
VNALAADAVPSASQSVPSASQSDPSFQKFLHTLVKSGSDKVFHIQKTYKNQMPVIQKAADDEIISNSAKRVNLEGSESDEESDDINSEGNYVDNSRVVMALGAPSLQHEHTAVIISMDGAQPEDDGGQEDMCSQVEDAVMSEANPIPPPPRVSSRLADQGNLADRVEDRARHIASARNLEGTNLSSHNSFSVLDDDNIYARALEMGVDPSSFSFEKVNCMKDLEIARHSLIEKQKDKTSDQEETLPHQPLLLGFGEDSDDELDFTPVLSRKSKKKLRSERKMKKKEEVLCQINSTGGAQAKSCAASVKVRNYHPLSDIVSGSRVRKQNPKYK